MGGKSTRKTRLAALDRVFGEWVRRRYADEAERVSCVTCGAQMHWKEANAGHFWKRQHMGTRFDPRNVHVQCVRCNKWQNGKEAEHASYIIKTYGLEVYQDLHERHVQIKKWTRHEIDSLIAFYTLKLTALSTTGTTQ